MRTKLKWYYILLAFAVVGVVVTAIIRIITPPPTPVPTTSFTNRSVGGANTQFRNLQFIGTPPQFPTALPIGLVNQSTDSPSDLLDSLISEYQLTQHPNLDFIWLNQGKGLTYDKQTNTATLSLVQITPMQGNQPSTPFPIDEAISKANDFLAKDLNFLSGTTLQKDYITYFEGNYDLDSSTQNEATFALLPYAWTIETFPVFISSAQSYPAEILVSRDLIITKVVVSLQSFTYTLTPSQNLISIEEAVNNLNNNQSGMLLSFATEDGVIDSFEDITSGTLDKVSLEYRLDPEAGMLYPFYHFSGKVTTPTGSSTVQIATPAIKTTEPTSR